MIVLGEGPPPMNGAAVGQIVVCVASDGTSSGWIWNGDAWMFSHGTVRRSTFPALYAAIANAYGDAPDGEFVLPDLRNRKIVPFDPEESPC